MTARRAPIEVLEALAEAVTVARERGWTLPTNVEPAHDAYRAATAPLRTRAEVDAEIVDEVRHAAHLLQGDGYGKIVSLCSEPNRDEPETERISDRRCRRCCALFATPVERLSHEGSCTNATTDHDADLIEPERCGCEEAEALKAKVRHIREVCGRYAVSCCAGDVLRILDGFP